MRQTEKCCVQFQKSSSRGQTQTRKSQDYFYSEAEIFRQGFRPCWCFSSSPWQKLSKLMAKLSETNMPEFLERGFGVVWWCFQPRRRFRHITKPKGQCKPKGFFQCPWMFVGEYLRGCRTNSLGQIRQQGVELFEVNSDNSNDFFQKKSEFAFCFLYLLNMCFSLDERVGRIPPSVLANVRGCLWMNSPMCLLMFSAVCIEIPQYLRQCSPLFSGEFPVSSNLYFSITQMVYLLEKLFPCFHRYYDHMRQRMHTFRQCIYCIVQIQEH